MKLCSACLLGFRCVWEGNESRHKNEKVIALAKKEKLIPVCPEQLGGLPTPRKSCEQKGEKVFSKDGEEFTEQFQRGAEEVLKIAKLLDIKEAIFRKNSPSCGSCRVYDGTFSGNLTDGDGVTAALLKKNGITVISEEEL
ncbi:MAG: DUF523 domain-containing protein [Candidatus Nanoarchaeia archaeon]